KGTENDRQYAKCAAGKEDSKKGWILEEPCISAARLALDLRFQLQQTCAAARVGLAGGLRITGSLISFHGIVQVLQRALSDATGGVPKDKPGNCRHEHVANEYSDECPRPEPVIEIAVAREDEQKLDEEGHE